MPTSTDDPRAAWCAAFVKAQSQFVNPPKTKTANAGKFSYSYAALPDIIDSVRQVLHENGLAFSQAVLSSQDDRVGVTTAIHHVGGYSQTYGPLYMPAGSTPQEYGSAISYARRYALCAALGIAADADDDGAAASRKSGPLHAPSSSAGPQGVPPSGGPDPTSSEGVAGVLGKDAAPPSSTCKHDRVTDLKPDGKTQMPKGKLRCLAKDCGAVLNEGELL